MVLYLWPPKEHIFNQPTVALMKVFASFFTFLFVSVLVIGQQVDKTKYWVKATDTTNNSFIKRITSQTDVHDIIRVSEDLCSSIEHRLDVEGNIGKLIRIANKLMNLGQLNEALKITRQAIRSVNMTGDTISYMYSQLYFTEQNIYRSEKNLSMSLSANEREVDVLAAIDVNHSVLLPSLTNLMTNYFALHRTQEGLVLFDRIIKMSIEKGFPFYEIASYRLVGDILKFYQPELGQEYFAFAEWLSGYKNLPLFMRDAWFYISLGSGYIAIDNPLEAKPYLRKSIMVSKRLNENKEEAKATAFYYLAVTSSHLGELDSAIIYIDSAISLRTNRGEKSNEYYVALKLKGKILNQLHQFKEAAVINQKVYENGIIQQDGALYDFEVVYAQSLIGLSRYDEALSILQKGLGRALKVDVPADYFTLPEYGGRDNSQTSYQTIYDLVRLKIVCLINLPKNGDSDEREVCILNHIRFLIRMLDQGASICQASDDLYRISDSYKSLTNLIIEYISRTSADSTFVKQVYPILARSKSYAVMFNTMALRNNDSVAYTDVSSVFKLNSLVNQLYTVDKEETPDLYYQLKSEELRIRLLRYSHLISRHRGPINYAQWVFDSNLNLLQGISNSELVVDYYMSDNYLFRVDLTNHSFSYRVNKLSKTFSTDFKQYLKSLKGGSTLQNCSVKPPSMKVLFDGISITSAINRITFIPDEELFKLPFNLLFGASKIHNKEEIHEVVYRYTSHLLRSPNARFNVDRISIFAPMVSEKTNVNSVSLSPSSLRSNDLLQKDDNGGYSLPLLPFTLKEANAINRIFESKQIESKLYLGSQATKKQFLNECVSGGIVHVATHGFTDSETSEKNGLLFYADSVLSPESVLYAGEMTQKMVNSKLLVLSACKSAAGKIIKGEGVMTLAKVMLMAGAEKVLATLWSVNDETTCNFMTLFYGNITEGHSVEESLHLTKLQMSRANALPVDYEGFVLLEK